MDTLGTLLSFAAVLGLWAACAVGTARLFQWSGRRWAHGLALGIFLNVLGLVIALALAGRAWVDRRAEPGGSGVSSLTSSESQPRDSASLLHLQLFAPRDRAAFVAGIAGLGGCVALPVMVGVLDGRPYLDSLPASLTSCLLLVAALRRNGTVSWWRAAGLIAITAVLYRQAFGALPQPGAVFGTALVLVFCGYVGAAVGGFLSEVTRPSRKKIK